VIPTGGNISGEGQPPKITITGQDVNYNLLSSKDIDPEIGIVLSWHIVNCSLCSEYAKMARPLPFGSPASFCPEYWEIVDEYSEYERNYAMRGNP
jgi:hypothetical protein